MSRKVEELDRMKEEGRIKTYVKVGQTEPELCYVEINHTVFVLRERAFGIVVLPDNLFRIGNGLFDGKLFETLVPFLQCPDSDGSGFLPVYLHVAEFGFCLPYLYIGLYPAFLLHAVKFLHLSHWTRNSG